MTQNTIHRMFEVLEIVFSKAQKDGIINQSPFDEISTKERPKRNREAREYLTTDEVRRLMQTDCSNTQVKNAFYFPYLRV